MEKQSLTLNEACELLGVSREILRKWIEIGRLKATRKDLTKPKSPYLITPEALTEALTNSAYQVQTSMVMNKKINEHKEDSLSATKDTIKKLKKMLAIRSKGRG